VFVADKMPHFARDRQPISLSNGELHYPHRFFILELSCAFFFLHLLRMCDKLIGVPLLERQNEAPTTDVQMTKTSAHKNPYLPVPKEGPSWCGCFAVWLFCFADAATSPKQPVRADALAVAAAVESNDADNLSRPELADSAPGLAQSNRWAQKHPSSCCLALSQV
jgi:hypothetical protein